MIHSGMQIIVLCEDRQQEVFARHFLVKRGFNPRRNIETWIHYPQGEIVDEETAYSKLPQESDCKPCIDNLVNYCQRGLDENAPESSREACNEWQRILPPN